MKRFAVILAYSLAVCGCKSTSQSLSEHRNYVINVPFEKRPEVIWDLWKKHQITDFEQTELMKEWQSEHDAGKPALLTQYTPVPVRAIPAVVSSGDPEIEALVLKLQRLGMPPAVQSRAVLDLLRARNGQFVVPGSASEDMRRQTEVIEQNERNRQMDEQRRQDAEEDREIRNRIWQR